MFGFQKTFTSMQSPRKRNFLNAMMNWRTRMMNRRGWGLQNQSVDWPSTRHSNSLRAVSLCTCRLHRTPCPKLRTSSRKMFKWWSSSARTNTRLKCEPDSWAPHCYRTWNRSRYQQTTVHGSDAINKFHQPVIHFFPLSFPSSFYSKIFNKISLALKISNIIQAKYLLKMSCKLVH